MSARLLLSCGEASGDLYAGALVRELRALDSSLVISGLGGPQFEAAGGRLIEDYRELTVTGLAEVLPKLSRYFAAMRKLVAAAERDRPDALVVIDFPDFNFRLARRIKRLGVPVVYYVSPQIWAWRRGRIDTMRRVADRVLVIFEFEEELYRRAGVPVAWVGHPLIDLAAATTTRERFLGDRGLSPAAPTVAILPGSRPNEVSRILPDLLAAAGRVRDAVPEAQFLVARAPYLDDRLFERVSQAPGWSSIQSASSVIRVVERETDAVLAASDVALTASGTATVQAALHDTPMVIVYRLSPVTYRLAKRLVKVGAIGMVNLIAGEPIVPELVQDAFTPDAAAREAVSMLTDRARATEIRRGLARVRDRLGKPGASRRAAEAILDVASHAIS